MGKLISSLEQAALLGARSGDQEIPTTLGGAWARAVVFATTARLTDANRDTEPFVEGVDAAFRSSQVAAAGGANGDFQKLIFVTAVATLARDALTALGPAVAASDTAYADQDEAVDVAWAGIEASAAEAAQRAARERRTGAPAQPKGGLEPPMQAREAGDEAGRPISQAAGHADAADADADVDDMKQDIRGPTNVEELDADDAPDGAVGPPGNYVREDGPHDEQALDARAARGRGDRAARLPAAAVLAAQLSGLESEQPDRVSDDPFAYLSALGAARTQFTVTPQTGKLSGPTGPLAALPHPPVVNAHLEDDWRRLELTAPVGGGAPSLSAWRTRHSRSLARAELRALRERLPARALDELWPLADYKVAVAAGELGEYERLLRSEEAARKQLYLLRTARGIETYVASTQRDVDDLHAADARTTAECGLSCDGLLNLADRLRDALELDLVETVVDSRAKRQALSLATPAQRKLALASASSAMHDEAHVAWRTNNAKVVKTMATAPPPATGPAVATKGQAAVGSQAGSSGAKRRRRARPQRSRKGRGGGQSAGGSGASRSDGASRNSASGDKKNKSTEKNSDASNKSDDGKSNYKRKGRDNGQANASQ